MIDPGFIRNKLDAFVANRLNESLIIQFVGGFIGESGARKNSIFYSSPLIFKTEIQRQEGFKAYHGNIKLSGIWDPTSRVVGVASFQGADEDMMRRIAEELSTSEPEEFRGILTDPYAGPDSAVLVAYNLGQAGLGIYEFRWFVIAGDLL
jgi:hypothetical protein